MWVAAAAKPAPGPSRSAASGRALASTSRGTRAVLSARKSMKASSASSAQCRSWTTMMAGPEAARLSKNSRQAAKFSSRPASSASRPRSGRRRARSRSRSLVSGRMLSRRASAWATPSLSRMPAESRTISERAQKVTPGPKGRQWPSRQVATCGRSFKRRANSASRRLLPMPGSPTIRATRGSCSPVDASRRACRVASSSSRPTKGEAKLRSSEPVRAKGVVAIHTERGLALPLTTTGWQASKEKTFSVAACVSSPTATAIGGAADCRREVMLTASPVMRPSPEAGSTPRRTSASPVLMPTLTSTAWPPMPRNASTSSIRRRPALTARSGSSSCRVGTPKTATTASPMNFSSVPPYDSIALRAAAW